MIVYMILNAMYSLFSLLTSPINIPNMPEQVQEISLTIGEYIGMGIKILTVYTDLTYIMVLFGLIFTTDTGVLLYKFVMWVIKKIPMVNIH